MKRRFYNLADLIISNIEGGYYSPERHKSAAMLDSGETMFGIDRKHGGSDVNNSVSGKKFWTIIDQNSASWQWNFKGGKFENQLKRLAAEMMYNRLVKYSKLYLTEKARKIANKSDKIMVHFYYACWNGAGWFKKFAEDFNAQVNKTKDLAALENSCITVRKNSGNQLIATGGSKMETLIFPKIKSKKALKIILITILVSSAGFGIYKGVKYLKNKN